MGYTEAQKEATKRYNKKAYDRIDLFVQKGKRQISMKPLTRLWRKKNSRRASSSASALSYIISTRYNDCIDWRCGRGVYRSTEGSDRTVQQKSV